MVSNLNNINQTHPIIRSVWLWFGPIVMLLTCLLDPPNGLSDTAFKTAGLTFWMASWWVTEVVPIPATSLLQIGRAHV